MLNYISSFDGIYDSEPLCPWTKATISIHPDKEESEDDT